MKQQAKLGASEALWMVEASAGTGKTYRLISEVLLQVLRGVELRRALVVTFSKKATAELSQRLQDRLQKLTVVLDAAPVDAAKFSEVLGLEGEPYDAAKLEIWRERVARAIGSLESASVMTLHSFCQKMLTRFGAELGRPESLHMVPDEAVAQREIVEGAFGRWLFGNATTHEGDPGRAKGDFLTEFAKLNVDNALSMMKVAIRHPNALVVSSWHRQEEAPEALACSPEEAMQRLAAAVERGGELLLEMQMAARELLDLLAAIEAAQNDPGAVQALTDDARQFRTAMQNKVVPALGYGPLAKGGPGAYREWLEGLLAGGSVSLTPAKAKSILAACSKDGASCGVGFSEATLMLVERRELSMVISEARTCWLRASGALWRSRLEREGWLTFDAMLSELDRALRNPSLGSGLRAAIREEFEVCLVDEFQDTDDVQWSILRGLFLEAPDWAGRVEVPVTEKPGRHFVLVGDPKQSVYRFRGSDLAVYADAKATAKLKGAMESLDTSRRTSPGLMNAINLLFAPTEPHDPTGAKHLPWPFQHEAIEAVAVGSKPKVARADAALEFILLAAENKVATARRVAARVAADRKLLEDPATRTEVPKVAVLVSSHADGGVLEREFRALGLYCRRRELPLMLCDEASRVMQWLNFVAKPEVERHRRSLALAPWLGWEVEPLSRVVRKGGAEWAGWLEALDESRRVFLEQGALAGFERLMQRRGGWERLAAYADGEAVTDRLRQVLSVLEARASEHGRNAAELARWMAEEEKKDDDSELVVRARPSEGSGDAVDIWTVHASKGLEADIVYLPFLSGNGKPLVPTVCKGTYIFSAADAQGESRRWLDARVLPPEPEGVAGAASDGSGKSLFALALAKREMEIEEARKAYVAMTRARHRVVIWWGLGDSAGKGMLQPVLMRRPPSATKAKLGAPESFQVGLDVVTFDGTATAADGTPIQPAEFVLRAWAKLAEDGSDKLQGRIEVKRDGTPWFEAAEEMRAAYEASMVKDDGAEAALLAERGALEMVWAEAAKRSHQYASAKRSFTSMSQQLKNKEAAKSRADVGEEEVQRTDGEEDSGIIQRDERWDRLGGTPFGNLVHSFYEELDFETRRSVDEELDAKELLRRHASINTRSRLSTFDAEGGWGDALLKDLLDVLEVPLAGGAAGAGCSLSEVTLDTRADESSFDMRMCDSRKAAEALLEGYEGPPAWKSYFKTLAAGIRNETGILTGKMDLVFGRPGPDGRQRWFIADYKTNRLDPLKPADDAFARYEADRLFDAMAHSHYLLQLLIYTVAWHRHLQQTLGAGYDYDRDFGGVYYLYVRGMMQGSDRGQFFIKPPRAWVDKLSAAWGSSGSPDGEEAAE